MPWKHIRTSRHVARPRQAPAWPGSVGDRLPRVFWGGRSPRVFWAGPFAPHAPSGAVRPRCSGRGRSPRMLLAGPFAPHALSGVRP